MARRPRLENAFTLTDYYDIFTLILNRRWSVKIFRLFLVVTLVVSMSAFVYAAGTSDDNDTAKEKNGGLFSSPVTGLIVGGLLGGGLGTAIGSISGHAGTGALIGAGAGAVAGTVIGANQDSAKKNTKGKESAKKIAP